MLHVEKDRVEVLSSTKNLGIREHWALALLAFQTPYSKTLLRQKKGDNSYTNAHTDSQL